MDNKKKLFIEDLEYCCELNNQESKDVFSGVRKNDLALPSVTNESELDESLETLAEVKNPSLLDNLIIEDMKHDV